MIILQNILNENMKVDTIKFRIHMDKDKIIDCLR